MLKRQCALEKKATNILPFSNSPLIGLILNDFDFKCEITLHFRYNASGTGKLSLEELKAMMEKLGAPQTHLGLKEMIKVLGRIFCNLKYGKIIL